MSINKLIIFIGVLFIPLVSLFAQQDEPITREQFEKMGPWAVVKLTEAYMLDYQAYLTGNNGQLNSEEKKGSDSFKNKFTDYSVYEQNADSALQEAEEYISKNENGWSGTGKKVFAGYKRNYTDALNDSNYSISIFTYHPTLDNGKILPVNNRTDFIKNVWTSVLSKHKEETISQTSNMDSSQFGGIVKKADTNENPDVQQMKSGNADDIDKSASKLFSTALIVAIIFLIAALVFLLVKIKKAFQKIDEAEELLLEREMKYNAISKEYNNLKWQFNQLKDDNVKLKHQLENNHLKKQISDDNEKETNKESQYDPSSQPTDNRPNAIYLPFPYEDSKFYAGDQSNTPTKDSFYEVILDNTLQLGELSVISSNALINTAFNSHDMFLKSVCEYSNALESFHNDISTITPGKVRLEGDEWVVTQKVKIKFI